jgi:hypothetical protein
LAAGLVVLLTIGSWWPPAAANDIAEFETVFATDVVYAGLGGMRGDGTGSVELSGVSGTVTLAYLYWHGPTNSDDPASNAAVTFNGTDTTGTHIGTSADNCWGFDNSQAYRADVTALVAGNGTYSLSNFIKPGGVNVNGVSLVVFFDDGDDTNNRDVVIFDGNDSNVADNGFDADGWNATLADIDYSSGDVSLDLHVSDGQTFPDDAVTVNGTEIAAAGPVFQGDTVPNAGNFETLWDIRAFDATSLMTPGNNTLNLQSDYLNDCLSLIVAAVNLPAGAAPGQPTTTTTTTTTTTVAETTTAPAAAPAPAPTPAPAPAAPAPATAARPTFTG